MTAVTADHHVPTTPTQHGAFRRYVFGPGWIRAAWMFCLLGAIGYLGFDIAALGATLAATGRPVGAAPLILAYLIGYLANLIPIPGGFGVLEGGLAGCLIAYGAAPSQAAAAVVVYHAIAFWIPSLGGLAAFGLLRRRFDGAVQADQPPAPNRRACAGSLPAVRWTPDVCRSAARS